MCLLVGHGSVFGGGGGGGVTICQLITEEIRTAFSVISSLATEVDESGDYIIIKYHNPSHSRDFQSHRGLTLSGSLPLSPPALTC